MLLIVTTIAVLALALGSVGTAIAGPMLTKGKVKSIATKVVMKKAPTLMVARAAAADSATTLAGQPPSAFQDSATIHGVDVTTPTTDFKITIPLTAGNKYVVSYSAHLESPSAATCYIERAVGANSTFVGEASADADIYDPGLSGVGYVNVSAGMVVSLGCEANTAVTTNPNEPIQIIVQKLDNVSGGPLTAVPVPRGARQN